MKCEDERLNLTPNAARRGDLKLRSQIKCSSLRFKCNSLLHLNRGLPGRPVYDLSTVRQRLWDLSAKDPAANPVVLRGHEGWVKAVATRPDTHWLVAGSDDKRARLWDPRAKDPAANPVVLRGHEGE